MGMPIASSPREASSTSGQRLLDEARLMPIHVIAALACLGGAALDGYILGISALRWRWPRTNCC